MSTWFVQDKRTWAEWLTLNILKVGPIPTHLALIMDGNRRYAKLKQQSTVQGHMDGFKTLANVLAWCKDLGINEVTAYAFSIENFKRSKEEVDGLLNIAIEKFEQLLKEREKLMENGVCVRVIGDLDLLPDRLKSLAAEAMLLTKDNKTCTLNLAIAYTSRHELTEAMKICADGVSKGKLNELDVSPQLLEQCMYTHDGKHPDLMLRTSGETRLSDFLLWQSQFSCLFFTKVLWPELNIWHLFGAIFHYQRHHHMIVAARKEALQIHNNFGQDTPLDNCPTNYNEDLQTINDSRPARIHSFSDSLSETRRQYLLKLAAMKEDIDDTTNSSKKEIFPLPQNILQYEQTSCVY